MKTNQLLTNRCRDRRLIAAQLQEAGASLDDIARLIAALKAERDNAERREWEVLGRSGVLAAQVAELQASLSAAAAENSRLRAEIAAPASSRIMENCH